MDIQNDTNQPVDYDIQIDGGQITIEASGTQSVGGNPKFRIEGDGGTMSFELAPGGSTVTHIFLIHPDTPSPTLVELRGAPIQGKAKLVEVEHEGVAFYAVQTTP